MKKWLESLRVKRYVLFFFLFSVILAKSHIVASAETIVLDAKSIKYQWFFSDGYIITGERSFENDHSIVKKLHCYDNLGQCIWSHSLEHPAIGMMYCEKTSTNLFAVLYRFDSRYYIEFLDHNGILQHAASIPNAKNAILIEDGLVYVTSNFQKGNLVFLNWLGNTSEWKLDDYPSFSLGSALSSEDRIYLQIFHNNNQNDFSSSLIALCKDGTVAWKYPLGPNKDCMFTAWSINKTGGFTMQVQNYHDNDKQTSELISIASNGSEQWRYTFDTFPEVFTAQLIEERSDNTYVIFGLLRTVTKSASESVVKVTFDPFTKETTVSNLAAGYGTCVYFQDNLPFILSYTNDLTSMSLYPAE